MDDGAESLQECFAHADKKRLALDELPTGTEDQVQQAIAAALAQYQLCSRIVQDAAIFSRNEDLDEVSSGDLQYMLIDFWVGDLTLQLAESDRKAVLARAAGSFEAYMDLLENYAVLSAEDIRIYERYRQNPASFSVASTTDAAQRRHTKIANFKEEKNLKTRLDYLRRKGAREDDEIRRSLNTTHILLRKHQAFQHLDAISQELQVLALAPSPSDTINGHAAVDERAQHREPDGRFSERLDPPISELLRNGRGGPILNQDGRPLRPFTLLDTRQRLQQGVFRPDHSLPTMTIDEYLEEERRRGGMINGGGPQSQTREEADEDDMDKADEATMKARQWDEYVEENPRGAGNRMNMG